MQVLRDSNVNKKVAKRKLTKEEKKAKKAEYDKEYYLKNKDRISECGKKYHIKNRDRIIERNAKKIKLKRFLIPCACGCGKLIWNIGLDGKPRTFSKGHHSKGRMGKDSTSWEGGRMMSGGRKKDRFGYWLRYVGREHHRADKKGYVAEHILVYEETHDCCIWKKNGVVHHRDEDRTNNVWYNLKGMTKAEHQRLHHKDKKLSREKCLALLVNTDNRICSLCGKQKTRMHKNNYAGLRPHWYNLIKGVENGLYKCSSCAQEQGRLNRKKPIILILIASLFNLRYIENQNSINNTVRILVQRGLLIPKGKFGFE